MKRMFFVMMILAAMLFALCVTASAEAIDSSAANVEIINVADDATVSFAADSTEKINVSYGTNLEGYYLVMMLTPNESGNYIPTKDSIQYIDQATAVDGEVEFTVYPKEMTAGKIMLYGAGVGGTDADGNTVNQLDLAEVKEVSTQPTVQNLTGEGTAAAQYSFNDDYTTMSVEHTLACVVLIGHSDGTNTTYTRLVAKENTTDGGYDFDISGIKDDEWIVIAVKGDIGLDGRIRAGEVTQIKATQLGKLDTFSDLQMIVSDLDGNGRIRAGEVTQIKAAQLGKLDLIW